MKHPLIILSFLLLSTLLTSCEKNVFSPVIGNNHKGETLYEWETSSGKVWKDFGDKETHPIYKGDVENGVPNGLGVLEVLSVGLKYIGEFKDGKPNGQGTLTFPNGDKYIGEFKDDKFNGQGTFTYQNGDKYVGEFKDDKKHGQGTSTWSNGDKYVGEWKDGKKHGQGNMTLPDESASPTESAITAEVTKPAQFAIPNEPTIETEISKSVEAPSTGKEGILYYRLVNGSWSFFEKGDDGKDSKYIGDIKNKQPNGKGTINLPYGKYVGEWKNGLLDGFGIFDYSDGSKYIGNHKSGKTNGQGFWSLATGSIYVGIFKGDLLENGIVSYANDNQFIGKLRHGIPFLGTLILPDGTKYVGEFKKNGKMWNGQMFIENYAFIVKVVDGKESLIVKNEETLYGWMNADSEFIWKAFGNKLNDGYYIGQVSHGVPNGHGSLTLPDGSTYIGGFKDGYIHGAVEVIGGEGDVVFKSIGQFKFGKANGQILGIYHNGNILMGEFKEDQPWEVIYFDKNMNILNKWVNGKKESLSENLL